MGALGLLVLAAAVTPTPPSPIEPAGLERTEAVTLPVGAAAGAAALVRRELELHGLPVRGAYEVVESSGAQRTLASRLPIARPRRLPSEAVLSADDVLELLARAGEPAPDREPRLVYRLVLDTPVLAWEVSLPLQLWPRPSLRTLWIGAASGRRLDEYDATFSSRAQVFAEDPSTTPEPIEVEFSTHTVDVEGLPMSSPVLEIFGCGEAPLEEAPSWADSLGCVPRQLARSDGSGDYFVPLPDIALIEQNRSTDDAYAEVAAYYYAERFLETMADRGLTQTRCERFTLAVNIHSIDEHGELDGMEGATYIDTCSESSPQMVIGQGNDADYAWDSGVVYHEMGHSVIQDLTPDGLVERRYAPTGILSEAGAINEGVADYLSMTVSDDPYMAEYVGRFTVASGAPYFRNGLNQRTCPDDLIAEWHHDSQPVSAALWAIRSRVGAELTDAMLLQTLPRLAPDSVLDDFGSAYLAVAEQFHAAGQLDDFGLAIVNRSLDTRGLLECLHVIDDPDLATTGKRMLVLGGDDRIQPHAPGPMQLRYEVPEDAREVTIWLTMSGGEPEQRAMSLLVSRDGEPVTFEYETRPPTEDEDADEVIMVTSDHAVELEAESLNGEDFIARLRVRPGEVLHVALANRTPARVTVTNFFVVASDPTTTPDEGCGCRGSESSPGPWALVLLAAARRRRRSRGRRSR